MTFLFKERKMPNKVTTTTNIPFYKSAIVWVALATIFLGAVDQLNLIGSTLPAEYQGVFTMILGALTLAARAVSGTISLKK